MQVHLLSVPNTCPTSRYELDGFCLRTLLFARLLKQMGHTVLLYGVGTECEVPVDAFVSCMTVEEQQKFIGETPYQSVQFDGALPLFLTFNTRAAHHIRAHKTPTDIICTIAGSAQMFVHEWNPDLPFIEYSIGYRGICADYRVYQSQAWRHVVQGYTGVDYGRPYDAVIPPWYPVEDFHARPDSEDYVLFCGRITTVKGIQMAQDAAREAGVKLVVIGHGDPSLVTYGEVHEAVSGAERNRLMAGAQAVLMPTQYIEPFGNVAAEAQLCGTPVIGPDYGAFSETIAQGMTGFRCASLTEYVNAIEASAYLNRLYVRQRAVSLWGFPAAEKAYTQYFDRLASVGGLKTPVKESYGSLQSVA